MSQRAVTENALQRLVQLFVGGRTRNAVALARASTAARDVLFRAWLIAAVVRLHRALFDWTPTSTARVYAKTRVCRPSRIR